MDHCSRSHFHMCTRFHWFIRRCTLNAVNKLANMKRLMESMFCKSPFRHSLYGTTVTVCHSGRPFMQHVLTYCSCSQGMFINILHQLNNKKCTGTLSSLNEYALTFSHTLSLGKQYSETVVTQTANRSQLWVLLGTCWTICTFTAPPPRESITLDLAWLFFVAVLAQAVSIETVIGTLSIYIINSCLNMCGAARETAYVVYHELSTKSSSGFPF